MSCHEAEIAKCSKSFHMEQAGVIAEVADCIESFCMKQAGVLAEIRWLMLLAALEHNAACKTQEAAQTSTAITATRAWPICQKQQFGSMMLTWHSLKPSSFQFPATLGAHRLLIARACQWCAAAASLISTVTSS